MDSSLRERFDAVPYRHGAIPTTYPARLGLVGRLLGLQTQQPDRCRVLELGCAEGMNLLPMAERLPEAEFIGVDFSANQIRVGEEARASCGIENARLICADLREFEPEQGGYDYIIAHGVYSWVPDEVKDRLLATCARGLAPNGLAYISYNTLPGWGLRSAMREFLIDESSREAGAKSQLRRIAEVLQALGSALTEQPGAHAALVREAVSEMSAKPAKLLYHDDVAAVNDPCTFTQFNAHAERRQLRYVAEAKYSETVPEHMPLSVFAAVDRLQLDPLRVQQLIDIIYHRLLRGSVLCRAEAAPSGQVALEAIRESAIRLQMRVAETRVDLRPGVPFRLGTKDGREIAFEAPLEKAFLAALAQAAPNQLPFPGALATAQKLIAQANLAPDADEEALFAMVHRLYLMDGVDLLLMGEGKWLHPRQPAAPSPLMRHQAAHELPLTNRWHEPISLTPGGVQALLGAGGAQSQAALAQAGLLG